MKKIIIITVVALGVLASVGITDVKAFSLPFGSKDDKKVEKIATTDAKKMSRAMPAMDSAQHKIVEDPLLKEMREMQIEHHKAIQKQQEEFHKKQRELIAKYRKKINKDEPEKLAKAIERCETQAVEMMMMMDMNSGGRMPRPHPMP